MPGPDDRYDPVTTQAPIPYVREGDPGLGRQSKLVEEDRRQSGNLPDQPADNPVRDDKPFRNLRSR